MLFAVIAFVLASLFAGWRLWRRMRFFLHRLQLNGYHLNEYAGGLWTVGSGRRAGGRGRKAEDRGRKAEGRRQTAGRIISSPISSSSHAIGFLIVLALIAATHLFESYWPGAIAGILWCVTFASSARYQIEKEKKPLTFTARMKRLTGASFAFAFLPLAAAVAVALLVPAWWLIPCLLAGWLVSDAGAPLWVYLGGLTVSPVEKRIQDDFKTQARNALHTRPNLQVIGITGSYGKTSVKFITEAILKQTYSVLASPGSYNTPMGICIVVNQMLRPDHQILILEMGARYNGDIEELCDIAQPDIGIVTSVGKAHLATMGPIENIQRVKSELVRNMKSGGPVILNADDPRVMEMLKLAKGDVWRVTVDNNEAEIAATHISYGPEGSSFDVRDEEGNTYPFRTALLGKHNVLNILLGVAIGRHFGIRLRQMAHSVSSLEPVPHRLQLRQEGMLTVIDDAFNSNPVGARNAVEILGSFDTGKRIIITPGMVELGADQDEENRRLGEIMAGHIDLALLIGPMQSKPISEGLRDAGFPDEKIRTFRTLFEAQEFLSSVATAGDVVLYENDLPDQYTEDAS